LDKDISFRIRQGIRGMRECFQRAACRSEVQNACKFRKSLQEGNLKFFRETKIASSDFRPCRWLDTGGRGSGFHLKNID